MRSEDQPDIMEDGGEADSYPTLNVGDTVNIEIRCLKSAMQVYIQDTFSFSTTKLHPTGSPPRIKKIQFSRPGSGTTWPVKHLEVITMTIRYGNFKSPSFLNSTSVSDFFNKLKYVKI